MRKKTDIRIVFKRIEKLGNKCEPNMYIQREGKKDLERKTVLIGSEIIYKRGQAVGNRAKMEKHCTKSFQNASSMFILVQLSGITTFLPGTWHSLFNVFAISELNSLIFVLFI